MAQKMNVAQHKALAEQGNAEAQYELGLRYYNGDGVPQNNDEAMKWFMKAAEQGNEWAQWRLKECNRKGYGVSQNDEDLGKWIDKHGRVIWDLGNLAWKYYKMFNS